MNNQGFADLVLKTAGVKSTKEIARAAVESEWKRSKKRRRNGDSSDEESDDGQTRSKRKQNGGNEDSKTEEQDRLEELASLYRDRAKERRDDKLSSDGEKDEAATKLPRKGLDLSLARQMRREIKKGSNSVHETKENVTEGPEVFQKLPTMEEATDFLRSFLDGKHELDVNNTSTIEEYIQKMLDQTETFQPPKNVVCGIAGKNIQRSRLALALDGCPSNVKRSWEVPREVTHTANHFDSNSQNLDIEFIQKIELALPKFVPKVNRTVKTVVKQQNETTPTQHSPAVEDEISPQENSDDEDDDIFGGLDDYAPPAPTEKAKEQ